MFRGKLIALMVLTGMFFHTGLAQDTNSNMPVSKYRSNLSWAVIGASNALLFGIAAGLSGRTTAAALNAIKNQWVDALSSESLREKVAGSCLSGFLLVPTVLIGGGMTIGFATIAGISLFTSGTNIYDHFTGTIPPVTTNE